MSGLLGTVVITGAAGRIGTALREELSGRATRLVLLDRVTHDPAVRRIDLRDLDAVVAAVAGADAILHLGGLADEAPLADLLETNVLGTHHVLEAARRNGVPRVVLASSNRLTGFYPVTAIVGPDLPPRPDGLYGVSKVAVEALGRLYADKFDLDVVCLRIGSFEDRPSEPRHLATWLSPRDCLGFVAASLATTGPRFLTTYAVSNNIRRFWSDDGWDELGYRPLDNAEMFAAELQAPAGPPATIQGGEYASPEYTLRHL